jgi:4-hydroxybenzoate polyprenyltransferase
VSTPFASANPDSPAAFFFGFLRAMNAAPPLRTLPVLGRVAGLPTVWSNCLAGWWLGGGGNFWKLPFLLFGVSLLYTGGAFLNDAFDADTDRLRRPERPIPAGKISAPFVWRTGFGQLVAGIFLLLFCSQLSAGAAILLALFILLYNFSHKFFTAAPWLLGACRFWIYIIAGASGAWGLNGWPILCGAALAFYVAGASFLGRREIIRGLTPHWPVLPLAAPIILAMAMNAGHYRATAIWLSLLLGTWMGYSLRDFFSGGGINRARLAANLTAGVVFVDWLAVAPLVSGGTGTLIFLALFGLAKLTPKLLPEI